MKRMRPCADINPIAIKSLGTGLESYESEEVFVGRDGNNGWRGTSLACSCLPQRQRPSGLPVGTIRMILSPPHSSTSHANFCSSVIKSDMLYNTQYLELFGQNTVDL